MNVTRSAATVLPAELVRTPAPVRDCTGPGLQTTASARARGASFRDNRHVFALVPHAELPQVDLSRTLSRRLFPPSVNRWLTQLLRNHFHFLVMGFRVGAVCFGLLLFVPDGPLNDILIAIIVPATSCLFATLLFLSIDVVRLLARSYDFWFTSTLNAMNWVGFAVLVGDERVMMAFLGWFSFQIVIMVDASYRTFNTAVNSMILSIPITLVLCVCVALRSIRGAHFFTISMYGHKIYDANDIMNFTATTLTILLAKMVVLKKRRVGQESLRPGFYRLPCAFMKAKLRLVPLGSSPPGPVSPSQRSAPITLGSAHQRFMLSSLPIPHIDALKTLLPHRVWSRASRWLANYRKMLRIVLYGMGAVGYILLIIQTVRNTEAQIIASRSVPEASISPNSCAISSLNQIDRVRTIAALACCVSFCAVFTLFYQRDLLLLLFTNFDYIFSLVQVFSYSACVADMLCWQLDYSLAILAWTLWLTWALTIDALTPLVNNLLFRLPYKLPALVLASVLAGGLGTVYVVLFLDNRGLRDRVLLTFAVSSTRSFALTTRSVMVGRMATIALWCSRQVFVLSTRRDGELCLVRGFVEYDSPFGVFPRKFNKHAPARDDDDDDDGAATGGASG